MVTRARYRTFADAMEQFAKGESRSPSRDVRAMKRRASQSRSSAGCLVSTSVPRLYFERLAAELATSFQTPQQKMKVQHSVLWTEVLQYALGIDRCRSRDECDVFRDARIVKGKHVEPPQPAQKDHGRRPRTDPLDPAQHCRSVRTRAPLQSRGVERAG